MTSLQRRLTVSYTVLVGAFISFVAIGLTWLAFDAVVRPVSEAIALGARDARAALAADPTMAAEGLAQRVRVLIGRSDVAVLVMRPPGGLGAFGRQPPGVAFGPPPDRYGPGGPGGPANGPPPSRPLESFLGVRGEFVRVRDAQLAIVPRRGALDARAQQYGVVLAGVIVLGFATAWLVARWIAAQAVAPLIAVTKQLQRFAAGDFSPEAIALGRVTDLGQLIEAYNGAAAQVAAALDERERSEGRMRRFLGDAGHELRTPLTIVTAYVEVLRKGVDDAGVRALAFATLGTETTRMRRLVDRLVALARLEQPETTRPAVIDVGTLARDAVTAIVNARGGDVSCEVESGTYVLADPADLHEAIANLVDNAVKYGAGSLVRVMVAHETGAVAVRVSDCGPGIGPADREKIFERFYRGAADDDVQGSGLGLPIAMRAARRAGGELSLERSGDGETVFLLRLPLHVVERPV